MKKRNNIFTYISILALSLCLLVSGVYAAKSASMTASGKVSFTAANCKVAITKTETSGYHSSSRVTEISSTNQLSLESMGTTTSASHNLGTLYFDDVTSTGDTVKDITIKITVQNNSDFSIKVTSFGDKTVSGKYQITTNRSTDATAATVASGSTTTVIVTLQCKTTSSFNAANFSIGITCVKTTA